MFERFTERARQVVVLAQEEARTLCHQHIGTEHLLLGLLREEAGIGARALVRAGVALEDARRRVSEIVPPGEEPRQGQMPFTPRAKRTLELALRAAQRLGDRYIDTEHLLLGLTLDPEGVASRVIRDLGADTESLANAVQSERDSRPHPSVRVSQAPLDWNRATLHWRADGLELTVPVHLVDSAEAAFSADEAWSTAPLTALHRQLHGGRLTLHSASLLDDVDPGRLRSLLDAAADRALKRAGHDFARRDEFLRRLREAPD